MITKILLYPLVWLGKLFSRFEGAVDKNISDSYYYAKGSRAIVYSPMGNWFSLGYDQMDADSPSFMPIDRDFGKDKNFVFFKEEKLPFVDHGTFVIEEGVIKDQYHVYAEQDRKIMIVEGADPKTFRYINEPNHYYKKWARDAVNYYLYHQKVAVDYESFQFLKNGLIADKDFLYEVVGSGQECSVSKVDSRGVIREINEAYLIMDHCVYANHQSHRLEKVPFKTITSVKIIDEDTIVVNDTLFMEGKVFAHRTVDIASFERFKDSKPYVYSKDRNCVYYEDRIVKGADVLTFTPLQWHYAKDSNCVYFTDFVVEGANPDTFKFDEKTMEWRDGKTRYQQGRIFNGKY